MDEICALWIRLSQARHAIRPGECILERIAQPYWDHDDQVVRDAWEALTRPENLPGLQKWLHKDMNPFAREATEKAIHDAQVRMDESMQRLKK